MTKKNSANNLLHRSEEGLIENIVQFSHLLRNNDISVSLTAVLDTLAGLPLIVISDLRMFHCLLRSNFISCKEDLAKFDHLFYAYWLPKQRTTLQVPAEGIGESEPEHNILNTVKKKMSRLQPSGDAEPKASKQWALHYSPQPLSESDQLQELSFDIDNPVGGLGMAYFGPDSVEFPVQLLQ